MDYENLTPQYRIEEYLEAIVKGWVDATLAAYPEVPSWRIEEFLDAFITYIWEDGDHPRHPCPEPVWRLEECLRAIYDVMTGAATPLAFPTPTNRIEEYLAAIYAYLADGTELPVPEPVWRIEQWLAYVLDAAKQGGGVTKTVSGSPAHITDALAKAALGVLVSIEPIQDLHGYANPWPGGGGKNLIPVITQTKTQNGVTFTVNADGTLTVNGTATGRAYIYLTQPPYNDFLPNGEYTCSVSGVPSTQGVSMPFVNLVYSDNGTIYSGTYGSLTGNATKTFTVSHQYLGVLFDVPAGNVFNNNVIKFQIESGSTATAWEPYENICPISGLTGLSVYVSPTQDQQDATTYAVDWTSEAGTVYGGTVDVVTGVLTVDRAMYEFTANDVWTKYEAGGKITFNSGNRFPVGIDKSKPCIMSNYPFVRAAYISVQQDKSFSLFSSPWLSVCDSGYSDASTFASAMAGNQLVYYLATPITYQLTAQEVQMLLGENYVWPSSGGTVSVTYYAAQ